MEDSKNKIEYIDAALNKWAPVLESWKRYDVFSAALLDSVVGQMEKVNKSLVTQVNILLETSSLSKENSDELKEAISESVDKKSDEAMDSIKNIINKNEMIDKKFNALLGIVHYNILLQNRLTRFKSFADKLADLNVNDETMQDPEKLKEAFKTYGLKLEYFFQMCETLCASHAEQEMLERTLKQSFFFDKLRKVVGESNR